MYKSFLDWFFTLEKRSGRTNESFLPQEKPMILHINGSITQRMGKLHTKLIWINGIFTARIRRIGEGNVLTLVCLCVCSQGGGGTPFGWQGRGYPFSRSRQGVPPSQLQAGWVPLPGSRWGYPLPGPGRVVPVGPWRSRPLRPQYISIVKGHFPHLVEGHTKDTDCACTQ